MPKFKNVSPIGALELPLIGRVVGAGEVIDVTSTQAACLAGQEATWRPVLPTKKPARGRQTTTTSDAVQVPAADQEEGVL